MFLIANTCLAQDQFLIDKVIGKIGGETILLSDVESQYAYAAAQSNVEMGDEEMKCQLLESLIGQKLIVHHAKLDSVIVSDDEVESQLDFRINSVLRQMNGDETLFEEYYGMTTAQMRENLREDMVQQLLAERKQAELIREVNITPKEVEEFYNSIPKDSMPFLSAEVELSEIVMVPQVNEIQRLEALQEALRIRKSIVEDGESFEDLAKKYSDDTGSGSRGGDLGFASRGTFVPAFEAVAYNLEKGEISEPTESQFGFHIIEMLERRGNKLHLRHILIKPEITQADIDKVIVDLDTLKAKIEREEITFNKAVEKYSSEDAQSYNNGGRLQNPNTGKSQFETAELPPEVYFATEEIEVGELSNPLEYTSPSGETQYRIIKLNSRTKPHQASLETDYAKIQNFAKESKKNLYFMEWVNEKILETYIKIDSEYLDCPNLEEMLR